MKIRTLIFLLISIFNAAWLGMLFVMLFIHREILVPEPDRWVSGIEIAFTISVVLLGIERLINLREGRKSK